MEATSSRGPAVERALLTAELRKLRQTSGETQQEVAKACEWSLSKFTRIENGNSPITKSDLEALLRHYGIEDSDRIRELTNRARAARQKGWWEDFETAGDKAFNAYVGYEDGASTIRMCQDQVIPGLLQVPEYTRVTMEAYRFPSKSIERVTRLRLERQRRVAERAPEQTYILDQAVLMRPAGDVMPQQLRHLIEVARKPAVTIHVIPFQRGHHFGLIGPFILLGFGGTLEEVLYLENARWGDLLISGTKEQVSNPGVPTIMEPSAVVSEYSDGFKHLQDMALDPVESLECIEQIAQDLS